jgi:hypothetical protein
VEVRGVVRHWFVPGELGRFCVEWKKEGPVLKRRIDFSLEKTPVEEPSNDGVETREEGNLETRVVQEERLGMSTTFQVVVVGPRQRNQGVGEAAGEEDHPEFLEIEDSENVILALGEV